MPDRSKKIFLLAAASLLIIFPNRSYAWHDYISGGDWDYYGSGRDHPYSTYIDRTNYVGPADYTLFKADYIDSPVVILNAPHAAIPLPAPAVAPPGQYIVTIPNAHGGFNAVVIKKSGEGFVGPDGEYYPEFPKVFQLQMKYGN